jgi:hypothetical protein
MANPRFRLKCFFYAGNACHRERVTYLLKDFGLTGVKGYIIFMKL